jgi:Tol biopolymer transport system component
LYPPVFNLRTISRAGANDAPLTFGDQSYVDPDLHSSGKLLATRVRSKSDIWRFPIDGDPRQNTRDAVRVTAQTGHVQTPTVSPDGTDVAYLSDSGGHANVWIARTDGSGVRQVTFERDPHVAVGVPKWSPDGTMIVFLITRDGRSGLWTIEPDGSGLRQVVAHGWAPCWSGTGQDLYYRSLVEGVGRLEKIVLRDGTITVVREEAEATFPAISSDGSVLYYVVPVRSDIFGWRGADVEIRRARGETGPTDTIVRIPAHRIAYSPLMAHAVLSPDDRWLAIPLVDGTTTNLWLISTADGTMHPVTDFEDRPILMTRGASWSADSRSLYAAVAEYETDIVLIDGLLN